jgi:very-short-patch-repair endonuclease
VSRWHLSESEHRVSVGCDRQADEPVFGPYQPGVYCGQCAALWFDALAGDGLVQGFESILDVLPVLLRNKTLTCHYRSEDERLIAFSNHAYYGGGLTTFPGATVDNPVSHVLLPHRQGQMVDTRSSEDEIETVVDLMVDHAHNRSTETLGVIAMGSYHANRVDAALRQRLEQLQDRELDRFFSDDQRERAFVKNLERVQGDERDAIILTVGYTKQSDVRLLNRFGPINNPGGERRLNVAVTRARKRITLVSGFSHTDMDASKLNAVGARQLCEYVRYAESGGAHLSTSHDISLNPFELSILDRLEAAGLLVIPQYGVSSYRIDFAIIHPDKPGEFVLAVEADGASYHSTPTARDRDRLRQQMLERLGWQFYRIWSTDWFRDQDSEVEAILATVQDALEADSKPTRELQTVQVKIEDAASLASRSPRPPIPPGGPISEFAEDQLVAIVIWIKSDKLLQTDDELLEEAMRELGFRRRGTRIVAAIENAINRAD